MVNCPYNVKDWIRVLLRRTETSWGQREKDDLTIAAKVSDIAGAPSRIRTCDLRIRSPLLYPAELWAHSKRPTSSLRKEGAFT